MTETARHVDLVGFFSEDLTPEERDAVEAHLSECAECTADLGEVLDMHQTMSEFPPEMMLDGPPDDADLLLQRTVRQVRDESARSRRTRRTYAGIAAGIVALVVLGASFGLGRLTAGDGSPAVADGPQQTTAPVLAPGTKVVDATDSATGAHLVASVQPKKGWVEVNAAVTGVPVGQRCRLYVVGRDGTKEVAVSWVVTGNGANLTGTALVDPADVAQLRVENTDGKPFVAANV